jgi:hypothetical protein
MANRCALASVDASRYLGALKRCAVKPTATALSAAVALPLPESARPLLQKSAHHGCYLAQCLDLRYSPVIC